MQLGDAGYGKLEGKLADGGANLIELGGLCGEELIFGTGGSAELGDLVHEIGDLVHFANAHAASGDGRRAEAYARGAESAALVARESVGIERETDGVEGFFVEFAIDAEAGFDIDEDEMIVGAAALKYETVLEEASGEGFGVLDDVLGVSGEFRLERFVESDGFGGDDMLERATLSARKDGAID